MCDNDGRFETHKETIIGHLGPEYFDVVQNRLLDSRRDLAAAAHHDPFEPEFGDAALEFARGLVGVVDAKPAMPT
jgi:hypothetical protein